MSSLKESLVSTETTDGYINIICMACDSGACDFKPRRLQRRAMGDLDVVIEMKYCGVCHSDLHIAAGHLSILGLTNYPCVPGHELAGVCVAVGGKVTKIKVGDHVGVGCMVDSCGNCAACIRGEEQKCSSQVGTYNGIPRPSNKAAVYPPGSRTLGGYCNTMVVHENFAILIPPAYPLEFAGPVMCAGITLYDPLMRYEAKQGTKVAIVGVGGLGVMGIKIAKALGCIVTAVSSSASKESLCRSIGCDDFVNSNGGKSVPNDKKGKYDLVINTIPSEHDYTLYSLLLNNRGKHIILGLNTALVSSIIVGNIVCGSRVLGSGIGGIKRTQEVMNLCAENDIRPEIEIHPVSDLGIIYEALEGNNASAKRYVLDIASLNEDLFRRYEEKAPPAPKMTSQDMVLVNGRFHPVCNSFIEKDSHNTSTYQQEQYK